MKKHFYKDDIRKICYKKHFTAEEIYKKLLEKFPNISRSSVYRNIDNMLKNEELKKIEGIGKKAYFEVNIGEHIHLIDIKTGKIFDIEKEETKFLNLPKGFKIHSVDTKIFGEFEKYKY